MKHKPRCLNCGHFIRNGRYCSPCVENHRQWCNGMKAMHYPDDKEEGRLQILKLMEEGMEHL